jgi:hypothetical protein
MLADCFVETNNAQMREEDGIGFEKHGTLYRVLVDRMGGGKGGGLAEIC